MIPDKYDAPMISSGVLIIDRSGTLKVINKGTNTTMFNVSNEVVGSGINTTAVLEDSGNFVLYDNATRNRILWQSFDHPTDTLLPGMKLGYNLTTRQNWTLTSWLSEQIPASGAFTLKLEQIQNSTQLVIYRRGKLYWTSGTFSYQSNFNGTLISDASGMYFAFQTNDIRVISMIQLSSMGQIMDGGNIRAFSQGFCYQSDQTSDEFQVDLDGTNNGCAISALPTCRRLDRDRFELEQGFWSGVSTEYDDISNISMSDCMQRCWNDCNCKGFSAISINETGCRTWSGDGTYTYNNTGTPLIAGVLISYKPPNKKIWIWILVSVASVLTCALTASFCYVKIRKGQLEEKEKKRRDDYIHELTDSSDSFNYGDILEKGIKDTHDIKIFSLRAILTATDNFSNKNKLGQGGYGPVYKGKLFDGREIAVKRLSKSSGQGIEEFKSELILISKLQHTNLVRLYGCCIHQEEKMLIYEFMPNKSLDFFIFGN